MSESVAPGRIEGSGVAATRDAPFLVLCCAVLFASNDIRFSVGGKGALAFSMFELWSYCLLAFLFVATLPAMRLGQHRAHVRGSSTKWWLCLYLLWGLLVASFSWGDPDYTVQMDYKSLLPGTIVFVGILLVVADDQRKLRGLQGAWFAAGLANVAVALSQYCCSLGYLGGYSDDGAGKLDLAGEAVTHVVVGFSGSANAFAQVVLPWFVVAAVVWLTRKELVTPGSVLWLALSTSFGFVLLATACKGALLWSVAGIGLGVAMTRWSRLRAASALGLVMVVIVGIVVGLTVFDGTSSGGPRWATMQARMDLAVTSWHLLVDHPFLALVGGGWKYWDEYVYEWASWRFYDAHNVFLNQILMYGIVGVGLLVALVWCCIREGLQASEDVQPGVGLLSPFPYIGAAFAIGGEYWFEPSFKDAMQKYQLLFVLAMLLVVTRVRHARANREGGGNRFLLLGQ